MARLSAIPPSLVLIVALALPPTGDALFGVKPKAAKAKRPAKAGNTTVHSFERGCTNGDVNLFFKHSSKEGQHMMAVLPKMQEAYWKLDVSKVSDFISELTPEGCMDVVVPGFPPKIAYSKLQRCIRKSHGVTPGCASCLPNYLQDMVGTNLLSTKSCMHKCTLMTPNTVHCLSQLGNYKEFKECLTPSVRKHSLPCLECSKSKLIAYTNCMNLGFLKPEVHLSTLLTAVKKGPEEAYTRLFKSLTNGTHKNSRAILDKPTETTA